MKKIFSLSYIFIPVILTIWLMADMYLIYFVAPPIIHLGNSAKNLLLHVPVAWVSSFAYLVSAFYAVKYLIKRTLISDTKSCSSATIGLVFSLLVVSSGMVWAKYAWGATWNWDPRETTFLVLLIIYFVYFALRSSISDKYTKAKLSAVYCIIAFLTVPLLYFIIPRTSGSDDVASGLHPDIITQLAESNPDIPVERFFSPVFFSVFLFSLTGFTLLYLYLMHLTVKINHKKN